MFLLDQEAFTNPYFLGVFGGFQSTTERRFIPGPFKKQRREARRKPRRRPTLKRRGALPKLYASCLAARVGVSFFPSCHRRLQLAEAAWWSLRHPSSGTWYIPSVTPGDK
ncbi:UNVERIFIED_CONTAM: hypothetical protein K2H54_055892 [Gekko kuhli]